ncbi:GTP 3',8-cyclase MoaA [Ruminococcaceae bacterium OttesenSCG-928-A11]|nr:GTP 3',8-cyclase MoaA [Ruminococcaceae bacterium OttesenSCG-928-A11]
MTDGCGRTINYLRVSVTDRCNLRCRYCMPEEGVPSIPHGEVLSFDEITRLVGVMAGLGVDRVRLTGGEPLVRKGLPELAAKIKAVKGITFLGLTTNGVLLAEQAEDLLAAGVDGLNISLDTVDPARFATLTRRDDYAKVRAGLEKALALPFRAVKINSVLAPESTEADWLGVVALAQTLPVEVRLIEWMPMAGTQGPVPPTADEALSRIAAAFGPLVPLPRAANGGPAQSYALPGFAGRVGIIPAMTHQFCASCNRLRLSATGDLKLCLFYDEGVPLKPLLRGGATDGELAAAITGAVAHKPLRHQGEKRAAAGSAASLIERPCGMFKIGG